MFGAIGRWFRSLGYFLTGRVDSSRRGMDTDPHAMRAKYDEVIRDKTTLIQQYKQAVAGLIAQQEGKLSKLRELGEEVQRLETLKSGALAKAQQRVGELKGQGAGKDAIQADEDYRKCLSGYNDFSSTLEEKQRRINEHEHDVKEYGTRIKEHKLQMQEALREIDKVKAEAADAVAEVISAQQERDLADAVSGIGDQDTSGEKLSELRRLRHEITAEARVSKELSGNDAKVQEAEFLEYARASQNNSEFEALVGLAESADTPVNAPPVGEAPETDDRLPE